MATPVTLVIDQGTHASRALLFDRQGQVRHSAYQSIALTRHPDGRIEQDPAEVLASVNTVIDEALAAAAGDLQIESAGLSSQRSTVVAWHPRTGTALAPAISWQDTRAAGALQALADHADDIRLRTGLRLSPHYGAGKLRWWLDNDPVIQAALEQGTLAFGPLASFVLFHLLDKHPRIVDHANASRTLLWNIQTRDWDPHLLGLFGIVRELLPQCRAIRHDYGVLRKSGIAMTAVNGDQPAILFAQGRPDPDGVYVNIGSGAFILHPTHERVAPPAGLLRGIADSTDDQVTYYIEGSVNGAGTALDWAMRRWGFDGKLDDLEDCMTHQHDPPIFLNTVGGLGSPWWRTDIAPRIVDSGDGEQDPARCLVGVLESIVFLVYVNLVKMREAGCTPRHMTVSGGLSRFAGICQRLADLSDLPVLRPAQIEGTARGMAWLADPGVTAWRSPDYARFTPAHNAGLQRRYQRFLAAMQEALETSD